MKSLEERAHDFARKVYTNGQEWWEDSSSIIALGKSCYIKGAGEQKHLTLEAFDEWLCRNSWITRDEGNRKPLEELRNIIRNI